LSSEQSHTLLTYVYTSRKQRALDLVNETVVSYSMTVDTS